MSTDEKAPAVAAEAPKTAPAPKAPKVVKPKGVAPVYAIARINGDTLPGDIFVPESETQRVELVETLKAARDLTDAELALFEKLGAADADPFGE